MARITRRDFIRAVAAAGGLGALPAAVSKAPAQTRGVTLRALVYPYPPTKVIRDMLPEYEKQTGVKVEWEEAPYAEALSKQMAELIAKSGRYDIFNLNNRWVAPQAGTGELLALNDLIARAGAGLDWQDFMPKQKQMFSYKGKPMLFHFPAMSRCAPTAETCSSREGSRSPRWERPSRTASG